MVHGSRARENALLQMRECLSITRIKHERHLAVMIYQLQRTPCQLACHLMSAFECFSCDFVQFADGRKAVRSTR